MQGRQQAGVAGTLPMRSVGSTELPLRTVWIAVAVLAGVYLVMFLAGVRFFVVKTVVLPLFLIYGGLVRERLAFIVDWLPTLGATLLFDAFRELIWILILQGHQVYYFEYVIAWEQALFGVEAVPLALQAMRTPWLDMAAVLVHGSHFAYFLLFGLVIWHTERAYFSCFRRSLALVMVFGLVGYAAVPTVPPWLASLPPLSAIPPVQHVVEGIYTMYVPEVYGAFATNPVAAMPSLHVAFPVMCALVGWRAYGRRIGTMLALYAAAVMFVVMYLGEHYAVDVMAGAGIAVLATLLAGRMHSLGLTTRAALTLGVLMFALTALIALIGPYIPAATF